MVLIIRASGSLFLLNGLDLIPIITEVGCIREDEPFSFPKGMIRWEVLSLGLPDSRTVGNTFLLFINYSFLVIPCSITKVEAPVALSPGKFDPFSYCHLCLRIATLGFRLSSGSPAFCVFWALEILVLLWPLHQGFTRSHTYDNSIPILGPCRLCNINVLMV